MRYLVSGLIELSVLYVVVVVDDDDDDDDDDDAV